MNSTMTIYLAGPIDEVSEYEATDWRDWLGQNAPSGCLLFNPVKAWSGVSQLTAQAVAYGDRAAIVNSDGVLANLLQPVRSFGTIREIEFARAHGKPVVVVADPPFTSCFAHDVYQAKTLEEGLLQLIEAIRKDQDAPSGMMILRFPPSPLSGVDDDPI